MGFRNPIVAGEELMVSGVRSQTYKEGVEGWRLGRNGDAQVQNLTTPGTVGGARGEFQSLTVAGADIMAAIDALPKGVVAGHIGFKGEQVWGTGTAELGPVITMRASLKRGRLYRYDFDNLQLRSPGFLGRTLAYVIRYEWDGAIPTKTSPILAAGVGFVSYSSGTWSGMVHPRGWAWFRDGVATERTLTAGVFVAAEVADTKVATWYPWGLYANVQDMGPATDVTTLSTGVVFNDPGVAPGSTKIRYDTTWWKTGQQTFFSDGSKRTDTNGTSYAYQGSYGSPVYGGHFYFDDASIRAALAGSTIIETSIYLDNIHTYYSTGMECWVGAHNGVPGGNPVFTSQGVWRPHVAKGGDVTFGAGGFGASLRDNVEKGVAVGYGPDDLSHYGYFNNCAIRVIYEK